MPTNPPSTSQSFGRTFIVAAAVLGIVALTQLSAVTVALFTRKGTLPPIAQTGDDEKPPRKIDVNNLPGAEDNNSASGLSVEGDPIAETKPSQPQPAPAEAGRPENSVAVAVPENPSTSAAPPSTSVGVPLMPPRPTPVPLNAFTPKQNPRFLEIMEQGKLLRSNGDTAGALLKFREAALLDPANALPLAESAYTFEKMSLPDKAADQWRQILAMGDSAGVYFSAAQAKLTAAITDATRNATGKQPAGFTIPDGKTLAVSPPRLVDEPDGSSSKRFTLHVPIHARAGQTISVRDVKVFVLFYEKVNEGKDIVRTTATVSNRWEDPPINFAEGEETLEVTYDLPVHTGGEPRAYYGYIIRLYYKGELQDTQAQPATLNQRFPADYQLPE